MRSHKKFGRICLAVFTFIGYKQTIKQTSKVYIYRDVNRVGIGTISTVYGLSYIRYESCRYYINGVRFILYIDMNRVVLYQRCTVYPIYRYESCRYYINGVRFILFVDMNPVGSISTVYGLSYI